MNERRPDLPALTGLRFFAALWVMAVHFGRDLPMPGPLHTLVGRGGAAVDLFFVLSGFVLVYTYQESRGLRGTARSFYVARLARIYPVYLLGIALAIVTVNPWAPTLSTPHPVVFGLTVSLTQAWFPSLVGLYNDPGWSLSAEAFFYALFPLLLPLFLRLKRHRQLSALVLVWLGSVALQSAAVRIGYDGYIQPLARLPEFIIGMLTASLWLGRQSTAWTPRRCDLWAGLALGTALLVLITVPANPLILTCGLAPLWALLFYALAMRQGFVAAMLGCKPLAALGAASYSLYILHWPLWCLLTQAVGVPFDVLHSPAYFALYVAVSIAVSLVVFHAVEQPCNRAIRAWHWTSARDQARQRRLEVVG